METSHALPMHDKIFNITFDNGQHAKAIRVRQDANPEHIRKALGFTESKACIFISGGAGLMSDEDKKLVQDIMDTVAKFAQEHKAVIIDGGTESGVMQMIGDSRQRGKHTFPLIGVTPLNKISYPGYKNPNEEAFLEDSHSHFVLVDGENWGDESNLIVRLTHEMGHHDKLPAIGILINGGQIAMHEVYLASTTDMKMPMIILEGSGRAADEISTAFRTGKTQRNILRAILNGGEIELVAVNEGAEAVQEKLEEHF